MTTNGTGKINAVQFCTILNRLAANEWTKGITLQKYFNEFERGNYSTLFDDYKLRAEDRSEDLTQSINKIFDGRAQEFPPSRTPKADKITLAQFFAILCNLIQRETKGKLYGHFTLDALAKKDSTILKAYLVNRDDRCKFVKAARGSKGFLDDPFPQSTPTGVVYLGTVNEVVVTKPPADDIVIFQKLGEDKNIKFNVGYIGKTDGDPFCTISVNCPTVAPKNRGTGSAETTS